MNHRTKILHVVFSLEPGGMENGLVNVARGLDQTQFEVHVCCLERGGQFIERLPQPENVAILNKQPGFSPATILALAREIRRVNPDLIHTHNFGPLIYGALATAMGLTRPILHGEHGFPPSQRTARQLKKRRRFYRACRKVQAVSNGLRQDLIACGMPANKIVAILNGVDTNRFCPADRRQARQRIQLSGEGPVLGIVGRFDPLKRHLALIEAFAGVVETFPTAHLLVVGDGGEIREQVVAAAKQSPVASRIHLAGFQKEPRDFYQAMDLLVIPSLSEGLTNVALEAMACGVAVLAHPSCGNGEVIIHQQDGIITDLEAVPKLSAGIETLLADPAKMQRLGQAAREKICRQFSMEVMVANYARLYREIAVGGSFLHRPPVARSS